MKRRDEDNHDHKPPSREEDSQFIAGGLCLRCGEPMDDHIWKTSEWLKQPRCKKQRKKG